jgi:hypothetical protein
MTHLTEEQIDELLMGSLSASEAAQMREHAAAAKPAQHSWQRSKRR